MSAACVHAASAQSALRVHAGADSSVLSADGVATIAFMASNGGGETQHVTTHVSVPNGWRVVAGAQAITIAANQSQLLLVSVAAPANAAAGHARIVVAVHAPHDSASAGVVVDIPERRGIDLVALGSDGYVLAGRSYGAAFEVRNRGNLAAQVAFDASTSRGVRAEAGATLFTLKPGESRRVSVTVRTDDDTRSQEDVLSVTAADRDDATVQASASTHTTIVGRVGDPPRYASVPGVLALRASSSQAGASPVVLTGAGRLNDGTGPAFDFMLRAPTTPSSLFGERDEYRASLRGDGYDVRLGDGVYALTPLSSGSTIGFGADTRFTTNGLTLGALAVRDRRGAGQRATAGVFIGSDQTRPAAVGVAVVGRSGGAGTASVVAHQRLGGTAIDAEVAASDSASAHGVATSVRASGANACAEYDAGYSRASGEFAGPQRGSDEAHAMGSVRATNALALTASASSNLTTLNLDLSHAATRITVASVGASVGDALSLDATHLQRDGSLSLDAGAGNGSQDALRARVGVPAGLLRFTAGVEKGVVHADGLDASRGFVTTRGTIDFRAPRGGTISLYAEQTRGRSLLATSDRLETAGVTAQLLLPHNTRAFATGSITALGDDGSLWFGQGEAVLEHTVRGGAVLALHARANANRQATLLRSTNGVFMELRLPVGIPTGPTSGLGRARGRVLDAAGRGVPDVLVRLGAELAITDRDGYAAFIGLQPGEYRASLVSDATRGRMILGDPVVSISSTSRVPASFSLTLAEGGRLRASVRQLEFAGTLASAADTVVGANALAHVMVVLSAGRDTIYQSTDEDGRADFGSVAPGIWTLRVAQADLPPNTALRSEQLDVTVRSGDRLDVAMDVVPQRRTVQFMGGETSITAAPATPPASAPSATSSADAKSRRKQMLPH